MWSYLKRKVCSDAIASLCIYQYGCSQKIVQDSEICADSEIARANIKISIILKFFQTHYCSKFRQTTERKSPQSKWNQSLIVYVQLSHFLQKVAKRDKRSLYLYRSKYPANAQKNCFKKNPFRIP